MLQVVFNHFHHKNNETVKGYMTNLNQLHWSCLDSLELASKNLHIQRFFACFSFRVFFIIIIIMFFFLQGLCRKVFFVHLVITFIATSACPWNFLWNPIEADSFWHEIQSEPTVSDFRTHKNEKQKKQPPKPTAAGDASTRLRGGTLPFIARCPEKWIFVWISRITRVELMNIFENISKWKRIFHVEKQFKRIFQKLTMNILLEYSEMEQISKWISNTSRNEDWIFKKIFKIWMNIHLNIYLNIQRRLKCREYLFEYLFEYSLPF